MSVKRVSSQANESPQFQFCALEYRPPGWSTVSSSIAPVILLVLRDQEGNLSFLVHPELRTIVQKNDLEYLEALLQDFLERAKLHPEALFKQLFSLGVGPLVVREIELNFVDHPSLREISSGFVELS